MEPLIESLGDIQAPAPISIDDNLSIIAGDLGLSAFEDRLSEAWSKCLDDKPQIAGDGFRVVTAFYRLMESAAKQCGSDLVLIDVGPNIGAMNRAALVAADFVVIPLGADLFSLQGLRNLGPTLRDWRQGWLTRKAGKVPAGLSLPSGRKHICVKAESWPQECLGRPGLGCSVGICPKSGLHGLRTAGCQEILTHSRHNYPVVRNSCRWAWSHNCHGPECCGNFCPVWKIRSSQAA